MNEQQLGEILATHSENRDIRINQADNGFLLVGTRRFMDRTTGIAVAQIERQAVATSWQAALQTAANFYSSGDFRGEGTFAQPPTSPPVPQTIMQPTLEAQPQQPLPPIV